MSGFYLSARHQKQNPDIRLEIGLDPPPPLIPVLKGKYDQSDGSENEKQADDTHVFLIAFPPGPILVFVLFAVISHDTT